MRDVAGTVAYVPLPEKDALDALSKLVPARLKPVEKAIRYELPGFELPDGEQLGLIVSALAEGPALRLQRRAGRARTTARAVEGRDTEDGRGDRIRRAAAGNRTQDRRITGALLYRLSYRGVDNAYDTSPAAAAQFCASAKRLSLLRNSCKPLHGSFP